MRVLVTGAAGYIGSHTVRALERAGTEVVALDVRAPRPGLFGPSVEVVRLDVRDQAALEALFERTPVDGVVHLAALKSVIESIAQPGAYFETNVGGTAALLGAMARAGIQSFVFSSTCAVYGTPGRLPVDETAMPQPDNPYGESKLLAERMLPWFERAAGIRYLSLRYFNAAGAEPDASNGEDWRGAINLVPVAIEAALGRRPPIDVYGADHPTPDGTAVRDFVHVLDLAEAHRLALEALGDGAPSGVLNLGTGRGTSVREVLHGVGDVVGRPVPYHVVDRRPGEPAAVWADAARAKAMLDWAPRYGVGDMVASAVAWHRRWPDGGPP